MFSKKYVAFIPVRGGSKSIPLKNIKEFCGYPLVYWIISAAIQSKIFDGIYVSTDSIDIGEIVNSFNFSNVHVVDRTFESATDVASSEIALLEFCSEHEFDVCVFLQATSPLTTSIDIREAIEKFESNNYDSLLSVVKQKRFIWQLDDNQNGVPLNYEYLNRPRRQDWDGFLVENGAFYISGRNNILKSKNRLSGKIGTYEMPSYTYYELDELEDWIVLEQLKKKFLAKDSEVNFHEVKLLITDVDGVLTDSGMYYASNGIELKKFNTRDGKGIELIRQYGIKVMFLTGESINLVENRARKLSIDYTFMGIKDKLKFLENFFRENPEYNWQNVIYIGDDINDLDAMRKVFFSFAPSDAHDSILDSATYVLKAKGGNGCVREVCDLILKHYE